MAEGPCCTDPLLPLPLTFRGVTSGIARLDFSIKAALQAEKVTSPHNSQLSSPLLSSALSYPSLTTMANKVVLFVTLALLATLVAADATGKLCCLLQH
jgi:hypothetical protein